MKKQNSMNKRSRLLFRLIFIFSLTIAGCTSVAHQPFHDFQNSVLQVRTGSTKALEANHTKTKDRFIRETLSSVADNDPTWLEKLRIKTGPTPLSWNAKQAPLFIKSAAFNAAVDQMTSAMVGYSNLLVRLSSPELLPKDDFINLTTKLNANSYEAFSTILATPPTPESVALISTAAVKIFESYLKLKRQKYLLEAITVNQKTVVTFSQKMQSVIRIAAFQSHQEYSEQAEEFISSFHDKNNQVIAEEKRLALTNQLIALDEKYIQTINTLRQLNVAVSKFPSAHAELVTASKRKQSTLTSINTLLVEGVRLQEIYTNNLLNNKIKAQEAKVDKFTAVKDQLTAQKESVKYQLDLIQIRLTRAEADLAKDTSNEKLIEKVDRLRERHDRLSDSHSIFELEIARATKTETDANAELEKLKKGLTSEEKPAA